MILKHYLKRAVPGGLALALAMTLCPRPASANVYATNLRLNGSSTDIRPAAGSPVSISYILNEFASSGLTIEILSNTTVVRGLELEPFDLGTGKGQNTVVWDGLDSNSNVVAVGAYTVRVTARSAGYDTWTQITSDGDPGTFNWDGRGIEVDRNPASLYYGRIYIANSSLGTDPERDAVGIMQLSPDATPAEEPISTTGGFDWSGNDLGPWKISISSDDFVYIGDLGQGGQVIRWDAGLSTNSMLPVLRVDNQPPGSLLSGPCVSGAGMNLRVWMADQQEQNSAGILNWLVDTNGACATNDLGTQVIVTGTETNQLPAGMNQVALDPSGNIYVCHYTDLAGDPSPRVLRFPAYDPQTNGGTALLTADWAVGITNDTYGGASGIAVDPTGTYVAVSFQGVIISAETTYGNTTIFYATNGQEVLSLDLGLNIGGDSTHQDTDCAWDAVGNVYYLDYWFGRWRAVSPPGPNQSTTVAPALIQVEPAGPVTLTGITVSNEVVTITFTAPEGVSASAFTLVSSGDLADAYTPTADASISSLGNGTFQATAPASAPAQFYRIQR